MKTAYTLFFLVTMLLFCACGNNKSSLKYDFSKIESQLEIDSLLRKIQQDNKDIEIDTIYSFNEIDIEGMHYAGIPVKKALITDNYTTITTDTINHSGKSLLEVIEAKGGLKNMEDSYGDDINFIWKTETKDLDFKLKLVNGEHLAAIGDKDNAELTIRYKPTYSAPLANIHKKVEIFDNKPQYVLNLRSYNAKFDIIMNDIILVTNSEHTKHSLNNFIINNNTSQVKIIATCTDAKNNFKFDNQTSFSAAIFNGLTEESIANIESTPLVGKHTAEFTLNFTPNLPWYPKAWADGEDLRDDKNLKQKINTLYKKLGDAFLKKNENAINDLFYQKQFEQQQINQDTNFEKAIEYWEILKIIQNKTYKYTIEEDYDIEFNDNGRLIWTYPKTKTDMLILTGKEYNEEFNFYLYQPKGTNELKIIRG